MCGYCTEYAVLDDILWRLKGDAGQTFDPLLYPVYLQESADWRKELGFWEWRDHSQVSLIAFCRHWSERIAGELPASLPDLLSTDTLIELQEWLATLKYPSEWRWVMCDCGPLPSPLPVDLAKARLNLYINAWTGSSGPGTAAWNHETLQEYFLSVSVAFDVVMKADADDVRLKLLAVLSPKQTPAFGGVDLWLQRRALKACVARSGVHFIKEHFNELRIEAILSVVMSDLLTYGALRDLHAWLQGRSHDSMNLGVNDLSEALERRANQFGPIA